MKANKRSKLEITTTIGCNVNCRYCPQKVFLQEYFRKTEWGVKKLSYEDFCRYIDKVPADVEICIGGFAEAFQNEDCLEMIKYAHKKGHDLALYTTLTGKGINKSISFELLKIPFTKCVIHIPDAEGYANIPATEEYLELLKLFLNAERENGKKFVDHLSCQGKPHMAIEEAINGFFVLNELENRAGNLEEVDDKVHGVAYVDESIVCRICSCYLNKNMLLPDGSVVLCCDDWGLKHILGNLNCDSYEEIMTGAMHEYVKRSMLLEESNDILCRKCVNAVKISDLNIDTWQSERKNN